MTDNYLSFNFKNANYNPTTKYSLYTHFGGFVINEGTDLTFFNPSSFSHEFVNPKFGNQSYFTGTTRENREFTFNIILKDRTLAQYKEFLRWLNPHDSGILYFDYNSYWGYDVKVNSIGEGKFTVTPNCGATLTYSIEVEVGFITINEWAATLVTAPTAIPLSTTGSPNPDPSDFYEYETTNRLFTIETDTPDTNFINNCNLESYLKFIGTSITSLSIKVKDLSGLITYYSYSGTAITFTLYTEYGIAIDNSNNFIALNNNLGQLTIQSGETKILNITYTGALLTVVPILREVI